MEERGGDEVVEVRVESAYRVLMREGLLETCTCDRAEVGWPDGCCFFCQREAGRRALKQALVWAMGEVAAGRGWSLAAPASREWEALWADRRPRVSFVDALRVFGVFEQPAARSKLKGEGTDEQAG